MQIDTKYLGEVDIIEQDIIDFENGLLGFENYTKFVILPVDPDSPLVILQSTEEQNISFVLAFPYAFKPDYAFDLSADDIEQLLIENKEDVLTYSIVTLQESMQDSTINLLAPIVINRSKKKGKQVILNDNNAYVLKYPLNTSVGSVK